MLLGTSGDSRGSWRPWRPRTRSADSVDPTDSVDPADSWIRFWRRSSNFTADDSVLEKKSFIRLFTVEPSSLELIFETSKIKFGRLKLRKKLINFLYFLPLFPSSNNHWRATFWPFYTIFEFSGLSYTSVNSPSGLSVTFPTRRIRTASLEFL